MAISDSSSACVALMDALAVNPGTEYMELLREFSESRTGQVQTKAKQILRRLSGQSSSSAISATGGAS
jgi:hypothetical protein